MSLWSSTTIEKTDKEPQQTEGAVDPAKVRALCREILIQIPHRSSEGIHPKLAEMMCSWVAAGIAVQPIRDPFGGFVERTRNYMVNIALQRGDRKFILLLDNDVVPMDPSAPLQLASHNLPVVSGIACGFRPDAGIFACVGVKDKTGVARYPSKVATGRLPASGVRELESCGAGVMMVRRDVFEAVGRDWFTIPREICVEADVTGVMRKTEDVCFSDRVREAGFKIYVDFSVHCFHDKNLPLHWSREDVSEEIDAASWDVTAQAPTVETR